MKISNKTIGSMFLSGALTALAVMPVKADVKIVSSAVHEGFAIATFQKAVPVYISPSEAIVVKKVANMFTEDVNRVTGVKPSLYMSKKVNSDYHRHIGQQHLHRQLSETGKAQCQIHSWRLGTISHSDCQESFQKHRRSSHNSG